MERQVVRGGIRAELAQRVRRARAHGVGCDPDADTVGAKRLHLSQVLRDGLLAESGDAAAEVAGVEQHERDPGLGCRLSGGASLLRPEVVELADRGEPVRAELAVDLDVLPPDSSTVSDSASASIAVAPRPEVTAPVAAAQGALERVAMGVDEAGNPHRHILSACGAGSRML